MLFAATATLTAVSFVSSSSSAAVNSYLTLSPSDMTASGGVVALATSPPAGTGSCTFSSPNHSIEVQLISLLHLVHGAPQPPYPCLIRPPVDLTVPANTGHSDQEYSVTATFQTFHTLLKHLKPISASASITVTPSAPDTYVALGDSYSSGEGNKVGPKVSGWVDHSGKTDDATATDGCDRSSVAYPLSVESWLKHQAELPTPLTKSSLSFIACSGATTSDLWDSRATKSGLKGASGDHGEPLQLDDKQELANARLVTLTIGGNDVNFSTVGLTCALAGISQSQLLAVAGYVASLLPGDETASDLISLLSSSSATWCTGSSPVSSVANLEENILNLKPILAATYKRVASLAPHAQIYVVGYPDLVPPAPTQTEDSSGCRGLPGDGLQYLAQAETTLDSVIKLGTISAGARVHYVDPNVGGGNINFASHTLCDPSPWFNGIRTTETAGSFHPNDSGQQQLAQDVEAWIRATLACGTSSTYRTSVLDSSPLIYYPLSDPTGPWACDASGHGNTGMYAPTDVTFGASGLPGVGTSITTSASPTDIVTGPPNVIPLSGSFTLEAWFKSSSGVNQMVDAVGQVGTSDVVGEEIWNSTSPWSPPCADFCIGVYTDGTHLSFNVTAGVNPEDGSWHMTDLVYDASDATFTVYLDGVSLGSQPAPDPVSLTSGYLRVGWVDAICNQPFDGSLAQVALYPSAQSQMAIDSRFNDAG